MTKDEAPSLPQYPGQAWCLTENKLAKKSCAGARHRTGTLDSKSKRTAYLLAKPGPESIGEIVTNLAIGQRDEGERW